MPDSEGSAANLCAHCDLGHRPGFGDALISQISPVRSRLPGPWPRKVHTEEPCPPGTPTSGHGVGDDKEGMVMRYLDETDEGATKIVKLIGDICGVLIYTGIVGLLIYTVLR
jgi:hypothetical protein